MTSSFTKKKLTATLTLVSKTFDGKSNTKVIEGLRMNAEIRKEGLPAKGTMNLTIYGMLESDMNALTTLSFAPMRIHYNKIRLMAGDDSGMAVAFQGEIVTANANYSSAPDLSFKISAAEGYYSSIATSLPKGFKGGASVANIMKTLATEMGYSFENNGVNSVLSNPYLVGSAMNQAASVASAADIEFEIDDGVMFIAPRNKPRAGTAPLISPETGLKGYPTFDKNGLALQCIYNPNLRLGGQFVLRSAVPVANGTWRIHGISHNLSSEDPGGSWLTSIKSCPFGLGML